jgi:hypothetical protein
LAANSAATLSTRLKHRAHAEPVPQLANLVLGRRSDHRAHRIVQQPVTARANLVRAAAQAGGLERELRNPPVGKAHRLEPAHAGRIVGRAVAGQLVFRRHDLGDPLQEPGDRTSRSHAPRRR